MKLGVKDYMSCKSISTQLMYNNSLKFQMAILQIHCNFLLKNFCIQRILTFLQQQKNNTVFAFEVDI